MSEYALFFDSGRCTGCGACVLACQQAKGLARTSFELADADPAKRVGLQHPTDVSDASPLVITAHEGNDANGGAHMVFARRACVHCLNPACVEHCPTGAIAQDEDTGLVQIDVGRCVACSFCEMTCPYGAVKVVGDTPPHAFKCDGCADRLREGRTPACVATCPAEALAYGAREDVLQLAESRASRLRDRGWSQACVLGETEDGGHSVIQVLKYGADGTALVSLAGTGSNGFWPQSAGALGAVAAAVTVGAAAGAAALYVRESKQPTDSPTD